MTLAEQIEAVLRKRITRQLARCFDQSAHCHEGSCAAKIAPLVADLVALWPQPSRDALIAILQDDEVDVHAVTHRLELIEKLLAWATNVAPLTWCEHIYYEKLDDRWIFCSMGEKWLIKCVWQCCPICGVKKPEAGQ